MSPSDTDSNRHCSDRGSMLPRWLAAVADPIRLHIIDALSKVEEASAVDLARGGAISEKTLRRHLEALLALNVIREREGRSDGVTPGRPASKFRLDPEVRVMVRSVLGKSL